MSRNSVHRSCMTLLMCGTALMGHAQHYRLSRHFNSNNGLPQNTVVRMEFDNTHCLWIGTEGGLVRFDGVDLLPIELKSSDPRNTSARIRRLLPTLRGELLVDNGHGITYQIRRNGDAVLLHPVHKRAYLTGSIPSAQDLLALPDPDEPGWMARGETASLALSLHERIDVWSHGLRLWRNTMVVHEVVLETPMEHLLFAAGRPIGVSKDGHVWLINPATGTSMELMVEGIPGELGNRPKLFWHHDDPCIYTMHGSSLFKGRLEAPWRSIKFERVDLGAPIWAVVTDVVALPDEGVIILGTESKGVLVFRKEELGSLDQNIQERPQSVMALTEVPDGILFTAGHNVYKHTQGITHMLPSLARTSNNHLVKDVDGMVWMWNRDRIVRYAPSAGVIHVVLDHVMKRPTFKAIGDSVFVVMNDSLFVWKHDRFRLHCTLKRGEWSNALTIFHMDEHGRLYLGNSSGLLVLDKGSTELRPLKGLENADIRTVDRVEDLLLAGTYGMGWYSIANDVATPLPTDPLKCLLYAHSFHHDGEAVWISTNRGLIRTTTEDLKTFLADCTQRPYLARFGSAWGTGNLELNGGCEPAVLAASDGWLYYPSIEGVIRLRSDRIADPFPRLPLSDPVVRVNGVKMDTNAPLVLDYGVPAIEIGFELPYWGDQENAQVEYLIPGVVDVWRMLPAGKRTLEVVRPPPGDHQVFFRKVGSTARGIPTIPFVQFVVERPTWVQWPALVAYACALVLVYWIIARLRTKRLQRQNKWLAENVALKTSALTRANTDLRSAIAHQEKLISVIAHDVVPPLRFVARVANSAQQLHLQGADDSSIQATLVDLRSSTEKLFLNANNLLTWIRTRQREKAVDSRSLAVRSFVGSCLERVMEMNDVKRTALYNKVDPDDLIRTDADLLAIVLNNALLNAILHANASIIEITGQHTSTGYRITVRDNGIGIPAQVLSSVQAELSGTSHHDDKERSGAAVGLGTVIIAECVRALGATATAELAEPGTRMVFDIPRTPFIADAGH